MLPSFLLFLLFVFLFFRQVKIDRKRFDEQDRQYDEQILRDRKFVNDNRNEKGRGRDLV